MAASSSSDRLKICHACDHRKRPCSGPCACLIDGRDIIEHARVLGCPQGFYEKPPPEPEVLVPMSPCGSCGQQPNIAEVKASPAGIQAILTGE